MIIRKVYQQVLSPYTSMLQRRAIYVSILIHIFVSFCLIILTNHNSPSVSPVFVNSFVVVQPPSLNRLSSLITSTSQLYAKKQAKSGSSSSSSSSSSSIKGFGGPTASTGSNSKRKLDNIETDRSIEARLFYELLENEKAGDNLKRTALGYFPLLMDNINGKLRGIVALKDMPKGQDIINMPYELAINLGVEGTDPTIPAIQFLKDYCTVMNSVEKSDKKSYYQMLPGFGSPDCYGSTDFFSDEALEALQSPYIVEETMQRRKRVGDRYNNEIRNKPEFPFWNMTTQEHISIKHLQWAVWIITSRVLSVQDPLTTKMYKLLIPYLDMCNHDRTSTHILTGRATANGSLRVVAGSVVKAGTQINIGYAGGNMVGNDRFIQDYGFLDSHPDAYDIVAQQLLGKRRIREGPSLSLLDRQAALNSLRQTSIEQDQEMLLSDTDPTIRSAIQYRIGVKQALQTYNTSIV